MTLATARARAVELIAETCADQAAHQLDTYAAVRPQTIPSRWTKGQRLVLDCSDYARFICRVSGIPDPAGNGYAPYGNSSSIYMHSPHIPLADGQPADIATFGYSTGEKHASILYRFDTATRQWQVGNFGRQGQPVITWLATEIAAHRGMTMTVCRVQVADPPPTHADRLKAMTGFYAWVAWRLGEGRTLWQPYGPRNPHVRPNVPKVIPASWWTRLAQFLANRRKGNP